MAWGVSDSGNHQSVDIEEFPSSIACLLNVFLIQFLVQASPSDPENFPFVVLGNKVDVDGGNSRVVRWIFFLQTPVQKYILSSQIMNNTALRTISKKKDLAQISY